MPRSAAPWRTRADAIEVVPEPPDPPAIETLARATVEELTCFPARPVASSATPRALVAVAAGMLVVGLALGGRLASPPAGGVSAPGATIGIHSPSPGVSPRLALTLVEPNPGATSAGGLVDVRAVASRALGRVHVAVVIGAVVLGESEVDVRQAGAVRVTVPVFAPPYPLPARLVAALAGDPGTPLVERAIVVRAVGPVVVWHAAMVSGGGQPAFDLEGFAPVTVGSIAVRLSDRGGDVLARTSVTHVAGGGATEAGAHLLGLARFHVQIALSPGARASRCELAWQDASNGTVGQAFVPVSGQPDDARP